MSEPFDRGDRPGPYLQPLLRRPGASPVGGAVVVPGPGGCRGLFAEVDRELRRGRGPAVFTAPVYAGDALASRDPAFAVTALREFVALCLAQDDLTRAAATR